MSKVVAKVNSAEITEQELNEMVNAYKQQTHKSEVSENERKMLLENLVENRLLREEASARNLEVTEEMLNQQLRFFFQQYGGEEQFKMILQHQNISIDDIKENMKADLQGQLTARDEIDKKLNVSDDDISNYYDQNKESIKTEDSFRASHILFKSENENAKESAEKVLSELKDGKDFAELAKEHSDCPSKAQGGDLSFFGKGQMVPEFENAVVSMEVDDISDLVETQFGYHIIKKTGHEAGKHLSFDEAKPQIKDVLAREQSKNIIKDLIEELREKFDVEYA